MVFEKELKQLGLKDKEVAVYLACLQLGPSTVQQISRKAQVVRVTTYMVLEALEKLGLATHYKQGKKTMYSAEEPRQLMRLLEKEQVVIDEKQHDLELLLPQLQVLMKTTGARPVVRYFSGREGLQAMRREMMMYSSARDTWYNFTPIDHLDAVFATEERQYYQQRIEKNIKSKTIFTTKSLLLKKKLVGNISNELTERRFIPAERFPSTSGMTIFKDRIAIGSFSGELGGVIVESAAMADMMRRLFELSWIGAEGY